MLAANGQSNASIGHHGKKCQFTNPSERGITYMAKDKMQKGVQKLKVALKQAKTAGKKLQAASKQLQNLRKETKSLQKKR
jgi:division protein CdvB (Snf7/Vps24/ESCRT-III family)